MHGFVVLAFCSLALALPHGPDRYGGGGRPIVVNQPQPRPIIVAGQPRPNTVIIENNGRGGGGLLNGLGGLVSGVGSALGSILVEDPNVESESS